VDAIDWAGVNRFLDALGAVAILANGPGPSPIGFDHKSVDCHMGAVATADTDGFVGQLDVLGFPVGF
jgi:hypothetical protein